MTDLSRADSTSPRPRGRGLTVAAAVVGAAATGVAAHNALRVRTLRREAQGLEREHATTVGEGLGDPIDLVVLGDSAADGFGIADPREAFPFQTANALSRATGKRVRVSSTAVNGARTADLTEQQSPVLKVTRPDVVVLSIGVNDAVGRRTPKQVGHDTTEMLATVDALAPQAQVVLVTCPDLSAAPGIPRPLRDVLGWSCRRVAKAQLVAATAAGVTVAPLDVPGDPELFGDDGFHPGPSAQVLMARAAVDALLAAP